MTIELAQIEPAQIELAQIRDLLLPGLQSVTGSYRASSCWEALFQMEPAISAPHIWVPKLTIPQAIVAGAAVAVVKNPVVTRRFWAGWFSPEAASCH